ncbi:putative B3 domain-containing protein At5g58280 [Trifolium pratense]|uniref:putative B3 domain-containing protein At5g58280 n=1 Tax=Trifolium pratense TaxID=57577 RepID=UPI001E696035|nr:putative B3 domain-containing protein At5g58280 [Trifolium pratense]XP_045826803.1 putative B3 domain-containing protein At5g58280 [Trifolium pratense]
MAKGCSSNSYEEVKKQRVEENKKRFEELGISKMSKNLTKVTSPAKKSQNRLPKLKLKTSEVEPRRSSRPRNHVKSYTEEFSTDLPDRSSYMRKRSRSRSSSSSWESYVARPLDEIKVATERERRCAYEAAEALQIKLQSSKPSFIKSMVRSHVYSCFWLGLPNRFCVEHLPTTGSNMTLEDEDGSEYDAKYIGSRSGLSGGWRAFALEHKLDDGDALVFELVEPARFKIYIVRAFPNVDEEENEEENATTLEPKGEAQNEIAKPKTRSSQKQMQKMSEVSTALESKDEAQNEIVKPKTRSSKKQMQKMSEVSTGLESKEEALETVKPKAAAKLSNKKKKSKEGNECEIDHSINTEQLLPKDNVVETVNANVSKKKEHDLESTKDKPDEKRAPKFFRKKSAPKFFRKRV